MGCALVTGGSRGIGAAVAIALGAVGWPVVVAFREQTEQAEDIAEKIRASGTPAVTVAADVSDPAEVERMFSVAEQAFGEVLLLVNNAGIHSDNVLSVMEDDDWRRVLATNVDGAFYAIRRALPTMVSSRFGRIVTISSVLAARSLPGVSNYSASKAAVESLTRSVAVEVARRGVTVNCVAPGLVETDLTADVARLRGAARIIPIRRAGTPEEVAACVRFLCSAEAAYLTGVTLTVDGGLSAQAYPFS